MARRTKSAAALLFPLLFLVLLSRALLPTAAQQSDAESCPPFSCGQLGKLSYPFRQRDDPPHCGRPLFQLNCSDNKSTYSIGTVDYLVTRILYEDYSLLGRYLVYAALRVVDPNLGGGCGSCGLPSQPMKLFTQDTSGLWLYSRFYASFMKCSKPIQNDSRYLPISCPSRHNSTYLYVIIAEDGYMPQYLYPSCEYLSMIPVAVAEPYEWQNPNSTADAFNILRQGFDLFLKENKGKVMFFQCLSEFYTRVHYHLLLPITFKYKFQFLVNDAIRLDNRLWEYFKHKVPFRNMAAVVMVFFYIVAILIVLLILARLFIAPIIIWFLLAYKLWSTKRQDAVDTIEKFLRRQQALMPTRYAYTDIIAITRHFKEKLGQGGFGSVFKGELAGGILVAVKMMGNSKCNGDDFISEVSTIGKIHHINVVRLVGYCSEGSKRTLVYEYMPNSSLDKYIFSKNRINLHNFTSKQLIDIAMGIARGIDYLYRGCDMQILHFDIKPHNILLDHNFTPKISDFGLARLYPKDNSLLSVSTVRGTIGYIAPELISMSFGVISQKFDVYSYGMLLMEMARRRRNVDPHAGNSSQEYYPPWIYDKLNQKQEITLENAFEITELEKKLAIIGLWCIQMKSFDRPTMTKVIEMLEFDVEAIPMPPKPFLSPMDSTSENKTCSASFSIELAIISE